MLVLGLTGSLAMGKSTAAAMFAAEGAAVFSADDAVHALYSGSAVAPIEAAFAGVTANGVVDRRLLGKRVIGDKAALAKLEAIVHPLVHAAENAFRAHAASRAAWGDSPRKDSLRSTRSDSMSPRSTSNSSAEYLVMRAPS